MQFLIVNVAVLLVLLLVFLANGNRNKKLFSRVSSVDVPFLRYLADMQREMSADRARYGRAAPRRRIRPA